MITYSFDKSAIIEASRGFKEIPESTLMDFLPAIYNSQMWILDKWVEYFKSVGVPFAISRHFDDYSGRKMVERYTLWKQRRI